MDRSGTIAWHRIIRRERRWAKSLEAIARGLGSQGVTRVFTTRSRVAIITDEKARNQFATPLQSSGRAPAHAVGPPRTRTQEPE
jgi:hypothetical protein